MTIKFDGNMILFEQKLMIPTQYSVGETQTFVKSLCLILGCVGIPFDRCDLMNTLTIIHCML